MSGELGQLQGLSLPPFLPPFSRFPRARGDRPQAGLLDGLDKAVSPEDIESETEDAVVAVVGGCEVGEEGSDGGGIGHRGRLR